MRKPIMPSERTLERYGLDKSSWVFMAASQRYVCHICGKLPKSGRLCIDHEHVAGWKKMSPEKRRQYVRGLLCWVCNHYYCGRGMTIDKARGLVDYLWRYEKRRKHERMWKAGGP